MSELPLDSTDLTWLARLSRALIREPQAADDLAQETVLAALASSVPADRRRAWLGAVARRLAARRFRGETRRARRELRAAHPESLPDTGELVARAEIAEQVTAAARSLPEPFRRTILLRFLEGLSPEAIAQRENKPVDTIRWRVRRGLERLRADLMRKHGGTWPAWCVALDPLTRIGGSTGYAAAGATVGITGLAASWMTMKTTWALPALLIAALCGGGFWLVWTADEGRGKAAQPIENTSVRAPRPPAETSSKATAAADRIALPKKSTSEPSKGLAPSEYSGSVVDERGIPIAGATVYLICSSPTAGAREAKTSGVLEQTTTDAAGSFRIAPSETTEAATLDLGATANGYLRNFRLDISGQPRQEPLRVVLQKGRRLWGRVEDEDGRPVAGLALLAHTIRAGISHVSPSQTRLRSERARLGGPASTYHQCLDRTDAEGAFEFYGLPEGTLTVRSLEPGWSIVKPTRVRAEGNFVLLSAVRRLGVRLVVQDAETGQPLERAAAVFRVEATFSDGTTEDYGQWVGRGRGEVSFLLDSEVLPQMTSRSITRAVFYGTVRSGGTEVKWRSAVLEDTPEVREVATVRVRIQPTTPAGSQPAPLPMGRIELDVGYLDGSPSQGPLLLGWRTEDQRTGETQMTRVASGRFRASVPVGKLTLSVTAPNASGSLAPWRGELRCRADGTAQAYATLPRGGQVTIRRPEGWQGEWFVRARFRSSGEGDWRGSWNYSTTDPTLMLNALRPDEWRFELRQDRRDSAEPRVRTVTVTAGARKIVQG